MKRWWLTLALAMPFAGWHTPLIAQRNLEIEVKAAFLYNFLSFIEWSPAAFAKPDAPLRACVIGGDPFGPALEAIVRNERISGRPVVVDRIKDESQIAGCHALYVPALDETPLVSIMRAANRRNLLVVGESRRVLELCGTIAFVLDGERVRFDINRSSLADRDLKANSKLLRVAREASDRFGHCEH
jgi:hypothetical protein